MSNSLKTVISRRTAVGFSLAAAGAAVASPAVAQSQPALKWRLVTSYPKSLDTLDGGCRLVAKIVGDLTDGQFKIDVFAAGEIVPALAVVDAVQNGTVEMGHSASYYYVGKDPAFAFDTCLPFNSWMLAKYDHDNPMALKRLVAAGAQVRVYSKDILNAAFDAAEQIYAGLNAQNPRFKKLYESWDAYRREESQWFRINELSFDSFAAGRYSR